MSEQTTGTQTPAPDGGDDAAKAALTGTPKAAADGGDAESAEARLAKLEQEKQQWLAEKTNYEELKREKLANANAAPVLTPANTDAYAQQRLQAAQKAWNETQMLAQQGDPLAQLVVMQDQIYGQQVQNLKLELEATKVPEEYREDVKQALKTGRYGDAQAALEAIVPKKKLAAVESEVERLRRENESLRRAEEARKQGVVGAGRSVPDLSKAVGDDPKNEAELVAALAKLERENPKAREELSRRYRRGELPFQHAG